MAQTNFRAGDMKKRPSDATEGAEATKSHDIQTLEDEIKDSLGIPAAGTEESGNTETETDAAPETDKPVEGNAKADEPVEEKPKRTTRKKAADSK